MKQIARMRPGWRTWTGRILPVLAIALLASGPLHAKDKDKKKQKDAAQPAQLLAKESSKPGAADSSKPGKRISLDKIVEEVQKRHKAKVVKTDKKEKDGRVIYELRLLSDEKGVWTVRVDAETGKEL